MKNFLKLIGENENEPSKSAETEDLQNLQVKTFSVDKSGIVRAYLRHCLCEA